MLKPEPIIIPILVLGCSEIPVKRHAVESLTFKGFLMHFGYLYLITTSLLRNQSYEVNSEIGKIGSV